MSANSGRPRTGARRPRQFSFRPRIINPVKIRDVVVLAAAGAIREAARLVQPELPWVRFQVLAGPSALSAFRSDAPAVVLLDDVAANIVDLQQVRRDAPDAVLVLLSAYPLVQCSPPAVARAEYPYTAGVDLVFAVNDTDCAPRAILKSVIRCAEDHLNVQRGPATRRFIFLLVDDEPRWFSEFLPVLYEIIGQRADVQLTRTYEEATRFLFGDEDAPRSGSPLPGADTRVPGAGSHLPGAGAPRPASGLEPPASGLLSGHADDVVCLITDIYFPRGDTVDAAAGRDLVHRVRTRFPRIPIIIASKAAEAAGLGAAFVLPKGDPGSLALLRTSVRDLTGMGDFVVYGEDGAELRRVKDLAGLYDLVVAAGGDAPGAIGLRGILSRYAEQDRFSTWLYMHGFRDLGDRLRPERHTGESLVRVLGRHLRRELLKMRCTPLVIDGVRIGDLEELNVALRTVSFEHLEEFGDNDAISTWLDQRGYPELANELRPIHGRGADLQRQVAGVVARWLPLYRRRDADSGPHGGPA
jgi:hypothetical protein